MGAAATVVGEAPLPSDRDSGEVVLSGGPGIDPEGAHDGLPLRTVGPDVSPPVQEVRGVVGHLMGNGGGQVLPEIFGEQMGVVADCPSPAPDAVHAGGAASQVEKDGNGGEVDAADFFRPPYPPLRFLSYQPLLLGADGFDESLHRIGISSGAVFRPPARRSWRDAAL